MKRIRVSRLAERDLDEIWHYIARNSGSLQIADTLVDSISTAFEFLARYSGAGTKRDGVFLGLRRFPVGKYTVYYRETGNVLAVSRVLHGMRDQNLAFSPKK